MCRWRIYLFLVFLFVLLWSPTCCPASNNTTYVNTSWSKLKILGIFGHFGKSHFDVFHPLLEELARRGHEITVLSYFPRSEAAKAKEKLPTYKDFSMRNTNIDMFVDIVDLNLIKHTFYHLVYDLFMIRRMADLSCDLGLKHPATQELLKSNEKYDVILTESFNTDCFLAIVHHFKAPYIYLSSHETMPWMNDNLGNEDNPSYIPDIFHRFVKPLDLSSRIINTLLQPIIKLCYDYWFRARDQFFVNEVFGPNFPSLKQIAKQSQALFSNTHYSLQGSRPQLPNIVQVGGLHIPSKIKPLSKDIAEFLDNANEGVLYFCLGSMVKMSTMPQKKLEVILNVLSSFPRKVIWKWENETLPRRLDHVLVKKWLPQFDVLNHPNVKAYFGHGGLLGLSESIYAGVPMILMPLYGDQFCNSASAKSRGVAKILAFEDLNEHSLRHAFDEIFNNTSYRENIQKLSKAYRDRPATPLETAVWWTEYIARGNGNPYLRSAGADLPWYQFHHIDVALVLIIALALLVGFLFLLIKLLLSLLHVVKGMFTSKATQKSKWKKED